MSWLPVALLGGGPSRSFEVSLDRRISPRGSQPPRIPGPNLPGGLGAWGDGGWDVGLAHMA